MGTGYFREMENIRRGPTVGDFVTILTERSMYDVDNTVARSKEYKSTDSPLPLYLM